jgi:hypothetical protein
MENKTETESEATLDPYEIQRLRRNERLIAAGIRLRPATGPWPPPEFETLKPRLYRLRRLWWPVRGYLRRFL